MPGCYIYAWDYDNEEWVKVSCTEDGEIIIVIS